MTLRTLEINEIYDNPANLSQTLITSINNYKLHTYVDTGSSTSLIRSDTLSQVTKKHPVTISKSTINLVTVTGSPIPVIGTVVLNLKLGNEQMKHTFHIVEPQGRMKPLLLGLDFLSNFNITLNFNKGCAAINNEKIPFVTKNDLIPPKCEIVVQENISVPPYTEMIVPGFIQIDSLNNPREHLFGNEFIFDPIQLDDFLTIYECAIKPTCTSIPIRVLNEGNENIEIDIGTIIGNLYTLSSQPISDFQLLEPSSDAHLPHKSNDDHQGNNFNQFPQIDLSKTKLTHIQHQQAKMLINEYADIFATKEAPYGKTDLITHTINTGDAEPIKQRAYRCSPKIRDEINKKCEELLEQDLIELSDSPWASPVIMVKKKAIGNEPPTYRMVLDFRAVNKHTIKDSHPVPSLDETIESLAGNHYFSVMDLSSGYHQIPVEPEDRPKTAFTTGTDLFQWKVCPMGLSNAGQCFQRLIEHVFRGMRWSKVVCYLDDICTFGKTFEQQLSNLREVFERLRQANLKLNPKKCQFFCTQINFLGHVVSGAGITPDPRNLDKVANWPRPTNVKGVRGFCSLASYYRRFIKGFSEIAQPLNYLTRKNVPFVWSKECETAFTTLKQALTTHPVVTHPNYTLPWLLYCDASNHSIGSVLSQKGEDGKERVIAYYSSSLDKTQQKWCTYDREFYAIIQSVRRFKHYLRESKFTIITDHRPLLSLPKLDLTTDLTGKRTRWALELDPLDYQVKHRSGTKHSNADSLSRYPSDHDKDDDDDHNKHVNDHKTSSEHANNDNNTNREYTQVTDEICMLTTEACYMDAYCDDNQDNNDIEESQQSNQEHKSHSESFRINETDLIDMQKKDPNIQRAISWIGNKSKCTFPASQDPYLLGLWKHRDQLTVGDNGLLYKIPTKHSSDDETPKVVIPEHYINHVLHQLHGAPLAGHASARTAVKLAQTHCYWPGMQSDINEYCTLCESCQKHANPIPTLKAPLNPIQKPRRSHIAVDVTEMPITITGYRYILTVTDLFTKYIELYPMKRQTAKSICSVLYDQYIPSHGVPYSLHSDRGAAFESELFQSLMNKCGIDKTRTTSYRPNCNGLVERIHKTIKDHMTRRLHQHGMEPESWIDILGQIKLCYNARVHSTTGFSPYFLEKGEEPLLPINLMLPSPNQQQETKTDYDAYIQNKKQQMQIAFEIVQEQSDIKKQIQAHYYNKSVRFQPYEVNDLVLRKDERRLTKLSPHWLGPYRIIQRIGNEGNLYRIMDANKTTSRPITIHYNKLKPYYQSHVANQQQLQNQSLAKSPIKQICNESKHQLQSESDFTPHVSITTLCPSSQQVSTSVPLVEPRLDNRPINDEHVVRRSNKGRQINLPKRFEDFELN